MRALFNLPAPAKINWFLHVTGRRDDGYHTLQTVFQFIDWCDSIDLVRRDDGNIRRLGAAELPEHDLCVRAAVLLQQTAGCRLGVDIQLRKSIPQQAGLGGGSSDAATVLIGLNRLWGLNLSRAGLMRLALQLGADVPVFIFGRNAWAQGVGEELQAVDLPTPLWVVVHPARGLSTHAVFSAFDLTSAATAEKMSGFAEWLNTTRNSATRNSAPGLKEPALVEMWGANDLQQPAIAAEPEVGRAMAELLARMARSGAKLRFAARMSGSGSAVFAWLDSEGAHGALDDLPAGWQGRVCSGLSRHPLQGWIDA